VKDRFTIRAKVLEWFDKPQPQITVFNPDGSTATLTKALTYKALDGCGPALPVDRHRPAGH
jgi:hypothetical protein